MSSYDLRSLVKNEACMVIICEENRGKATARHVYKSNLTDLMTASDAQLLNPATSATTSSQSFKSSTMKFSLSSALVGVLSAASAVSAFPFNATELFGRDSADSSLIGPRQITQSQTGYHGGYYYSFWTDGGGYVQYTNLAQGQYKVVWQNSNNFVCGKGWDTGSARTVSFGGYYGPQGNSYLALYGWARNPLVEYYIVEQFGTYDPSTGAQYMGSFYTDGSNYNIFRSYRYNAPSIDGNRDFVQYWSVRQNRRTTGSINTGAHFNAWRQYGMNLGNHNYMIMATEGYQSSGTADIYVG